MTLKFWESSPHEVAHGLLGKSMLFGDSEATILHVDGYSRGENEKDGLYHPLVDADPGTIYCPRRRNSVLLLLATYDQGKKGGCVLIRVAEIGGVIYRGPGKVTSRLGLNEHGATGRTEWIDEDTVDCRFGQTSLQRPQISRQPRATLGNGIGQETLTRLMPYVVAKYLRSRLSGLCFKDFINTLLGESIDEADFCRRLKD